MSITMRKVIFAVLLLFAFWTLCSCTATNSEAYKKITIGVLSDVNSIPFIVAEEKGLYEAEGAEVEVKLFMSAVERDAAFQAGEIDGCMSDIMAAALAIQNGFDVKITSVTDGDYVLLASDSSSIHTVQDFKNVEIGMSTNTIIEYAVDSILASEGLKPDEIKKISIPKMPVRMEMLENGTLKGACIPQPLAAVAESKGARVIATAKQAGLAPSVMVFNTASIIGNENEFKKMYRAYNKAVDMLNRDPEVLDETIIDKAKFPAEVKDVIKLPQYGEASPPDKKDVENVLKWMKEKGLLIIDFKYEEMIYDSEMIFSCQPDMSYAHCFRMKGIMNDYS